jgi:hypothetical protein
MLRWLAWIAFLGVVLVTILLRPAATRAWVLLFLYAAPVAALLAATRLGGIYSVAAGMAARYTSDVILVGALCIGVALFGLVDRSAAEPIRRWTLPAQFASPSPGAAGALIIVCIVGLGIIAVGAFRSAAVFGESWAFKAGRDYLQTAQTELAAAPPGTVFFDKEVPERVMIPLAYPYNLESSFLRFIDPQPVFVTQTQKLSTFDPTGHIRPATVDGITIQPGPDGDCGYKISENRPVWIPFTDPVPGWRWALHIGYLSSGDAAATVKYSDTSQEFTVHRGLNEIFMVVGGAATGLEITVHDPDVIVCTRDITVGNVRAQP